MRNLTIGILAGALVGLCSNAGFLAAQEEQTTEPILDIASEMNAAALQLNKLHTGKPTQDPQQNALKKIDLLIAELEKQSAQNGSRVKPNPTKPADASVIRSGPGGMGNLHAERREGKQWGDLPAKERERILQSLNEGFPSHYQRILERYFARLADEKPFAETEPAPEQAPAPSATAAPPADVKAAPVKDTK